MTRPTSHGGGEAGPPIAGDPSSFPADAELSRTLVAAAKIASLSTLTAEGYPYGSVVSYAADDAGNPVVLISEMAEHTVNARGDDRASMLIVDGAGAGDPLGKARLTLVGRLEVLDDPGELRDRYLKTHPYSAYYADFTDFSFWRLEVEQCRYVGGFGHMSWVSADAYRGAGVDPLWEAAAGIIEHMNDDHADANLMYAQVQAGLSDATEAAMVGIDRYGLTLRVATPAGPRMARVLFPEPLADADAAQSAVIDLLKVARAQQQQA
ncbi:HugZ family protein [Candidatus Poriferisodalis sp.]|uniref:HugZ family pyridoxamine 5'-phosphate oxidase n=1 Tax=Candidatus Poriferisodalis sp. TaxID=3101277 RepID=UPI003B016689